MQAFLHGPGHLAKPGQCGSELADYGANPAISLYTRLVSREEVLHFVIPVPAQS
jgi:hypothetical protein